MSLYANRYGKLVHEAYYMYITTSFPDGTFTKKVIVGYR